MKCIHCQTLVETQHDSAVIHLPCWNTVETYAQGYQAQLQQEDNGFIEKPLFLRLCKMAKRHCVSVSRLIAVILEANVARDELLCHLHFEKFLTDLVCLELEQLEKRCGGANGNSRRMANAESLDRGSGTDV